MDTAPIDVFIGAIGVSAIIGLGFVRPPPLSMVYLPGSFAVGFAALFAAVAWRSRLDEFTGYHRIRPSDTIGYHTCSISHNIYHVPSMARAIMKLEATALKLALPADNAERAAIQEEIADLRGTQALADRRDIDCTPVLRVCVAWAALFFAFLFFQSAQKFHALTQLRRDHAKKADDGERPPSFGAVKYGGAGAKYGTLTGDRAVGNMCEQAVPFFLFLYLHATIVDGRTAAQFGWYWLLSRSIYPFVFSKGMRIAI